MVLDPDIPTKGIGRTKQVIREVWNYKVDNVHHIPIQLILLSNSKGYSFKESFIDQSKTIRTGLLLYKLSNPSACLIFENQSALRHLA